MNQVDATIREARGTVVGHYRLLEPIGEGGCGLVFMAEQEQPIRRRVALKVIKLGMDTKQVVARFEAERQALALMDHPNIAQVFDAGATTTGRPYFVMELVWGIKITDYCDRHQLSTRQRLDLFIQVCHAVQHAHQKGIIHRDLKPSNILVAELDGVPLPKIIDFGIARAVEGRLADQTLFTAFEQFLGTPAYMSPEQAAMTASDIDTRSDIYSLGVLLYEMLTGQTPFDTEALLAAGLEELRRTICAVEPPRPSTRLRQTGATSCPGSSLVTRHSSLAADLDWIVMKCLEKDRSRRYETADGLAADLRRHLNSEPVVARPPSKLYRFRKSVRRNMLAYAAAAVISMVLVVGAAVSGWQAIRASRAERAQSLLREQAESARARAETSEKEAETEAARSTEVAQFMKDMLGAAGPSVALGRDTAMLREILDETANRLDRELAGQPEVEAELRTTLGNVYSDLSLFTNAAAMERRALDLRKQVFGDTHPDVAACLDNLGYVYSRQGKWTDAEAMYREALAMRRKLFSHENPQIVESLNHLADTLRDERKYQESRSTYLEAMAMGKKLLGEGDPIVMESLHGLSWMYGNEGRYAEAETTIRELLVIQKRVFTNDNPAVAVSLNVLADMLRNQAKWTQAEEAAREALVMNRRIPRNEFPEVAVCLNNLFLIYSGQHKLDEAEAAIREALAIRRILYGEHNAGTTQSLEDLERLLLQRDKLVEAESAARELLTIRQTLYSGAHPDTVRALIELAEVLQKRGILAESESLIREATAMGNLLLADGNPAAADSITFLTAMLERHGKTDRAEVLLRDASAKIRESSASGPAGENPQLGLLLINLGEVLRDRNALVEARAPAEEAVALYRRHPDWSPNERRNAFEVLGDILEKLGDNIGAEDLYRKWLALEKKASADEPVYVVNSLEHLALFLAEQNDLLQAEALWREQLNDLRSYLPTDDPELATGLALLTDTLLKEEKFPEAEPFARECLAIREKRIPDDWLTFNAKSMLGGSLLGQKRYEEAEPLLRSGYEGMKRREAGIPAIGKPRLNEVLKRLAQLCESTGRPDQAAAWRQKLTESDSPDEQQNP